MPTRRQLIQKITLNSTGGNIIFSNIPQNYTDLKIVVSARYALSGIPSIRMRFNSDSGNNYTNRILEGNGSTAISVAESSTNNILIGNVPGSATTSNTFCNIESYIPNYSSSNNKSVLSKSVTENNATTAYIDSAAGSWSNVAAINSINIYLTDLAANSTFYLYGITQVPIIRGGEVSVRDGFKYHIFKSSGSIQVVEPGNIQCLLVAGGGGGGASSYNGGGGGGGAGGYSFGSLVPISVNKYSVVVGAGGSGGLLASTNPGSSGGNSSFNSITSFGGGGGGSGAVGNGASGGSGGGNGYDKSTSPGSSIQTSSGGAVGYGNSGGVWNSNYHGGGGGGAGAAGSNASSGSHGGIGINSQSSWAAISSSGDNGYFSGGGGGGRYNSGISNGGLGGGGGGGRVGSNALSLTGGGGGAGGGGDTPQTGQDGGNGGSGIVIIRYPYDGN